MYDEGGGSGVIYETATQSSGGSSRELIFWQNP